MWREYEVDKYGLIIDPGKFEREPRYVPYYWEITMVSGEDDREDRGGLDVSFFEVTDEQRELFPELVDEEINWLALWEDSQGFVHLEVGATQEEVEAYF